MSDFPDEIRSGNRKQTHVNVITDNLRAKKIKIEPVDYELVHMETRAERGAAQQQGVFETTVWADGFIDITFAGRRTRFTLEIKSTSTPKTIESAMLHAKSLSTPDAPPMVVVPYLSNDTMKQLASNRVSGFDLCGNIVIVDGGLYIWNGGHPNLYPESRPIKNIYRGRGSIFARCFLLRAEFGSLSELREFALSRLEPRFLLEPQAVNLAEETKLSTSTASKVLGALTEDLIIARTAAGFRLTDPKGLIYKLKTNFARLKDQPIQGRTALSPFECWERLRAAVENGDLNVATTGLGSASHYEAMATENRLSLRVSNPTHLMDLLEVTPTRAFPNVELVTDDDETALFDCRLERGVIWASPIQTLLELAASGPREQDSARRFEDRIIQQSGLS